MGKPGESYRPSNGTEGAAFEAYYCDRCRHESEYRDTGEGGCLILLNAFAFDKGEDGYPAEWVYGPDGVPTCTAFDDGSEPERPRPCEGQGAFDFGEGE